MDSLYDLLELESAFNRRLSSHAVKSLSSLYVGNPLEGSGFDRRIISMGHRPFPSTELAICEIDSIHPPPFQAPCRLYEKRGHCHLWLLTGQRSPTLVCGGDWPLALISLLCVGMLGVYFHYVMAPHVKFTIQIIGYVGLGLGLATLLAAMVKNPGLATTGIRLDSRESDRDSPSCGLCGAEGGPDTRHCPRCDVCVRRHDHHNFLLGVCVGAGNVWCLRAAYLVFLLLFLYLVLWGVCYQPLDS